MTHSAHTDFWLQQDGNRIELTHLEPGVARLKTPDTAHLGRAVLVTVVDGRRREHAVVLHDGHRPGWIAMRREVGVPPHILNAGPTGESE